MARAFVTHSLPLIALIAAGTVVLALAGDATLGFVIGFAMIGVGSILLVSLLFYEVGRSEDRDRALGRRRRSGPRRGV